MSFVTIQKSHSKMTCTSSHDLICQYVQDRELCI